MKFVCQNPECKKTFVYAATLTEQTPASIIAQAGSVITEHAVYPTNIRTVHICPFCRSLNFEEYAEPVVVVQISSVKSVELDKVDEWIGQGYEVKELYAKTATMVKKVKA